MTDEFDAEAYPMVKRGNQYQDFAVGQVWEHHWGRTITESDNVMFSTATCNWNPMHLNVEFARAHGHPNMVVNPMLVLCTVVGMSVEDLSEGGGPFLGVNDCTFHREVYPGDTITARSTVEEMRTSASRRGTGIITWHTEANNQRGELVVDYRRTNLVAMRKEEQ